jgi:4-hydroxythreonine-4-phosphate dehydrogenase
LGTWADPTRRIVAADTGTRDAEASVAAAAVTALARRVPTGATLLKKVDSALRGHVAAEIAALRQVCPDHLLVFAPAFPRNGRVTRNGVQHIGGVPLHQGGHWALEDQEPPSSLGELLAGQPSRLVTRETVRGGASGLGSALAAAATSCAVAVCDAETDDDLDRIVAVGSAAHSVIWVGAAGLASALGRAQRGGAAPAGRLLRRGPYLAVIGSAAGPARRQAAMLAGEGRAHAVELDGAVLAGADAATRARLGESIAAAAARGDTVVTVGGEVDPARAQAITAALTAVTAPAADAAAGLVLAGGTTARALLDALGVTALDLVAELDPGIVLARPVDRPAVPVITKSGGFGDDRTLLRAVRRISPQEGSPNHD